MRAAFRCVWRRPAGAAQVAIDPRVLRQVGENLVTNAIKYAPGCELLIAGRSGGPGYWQLIFADRGPGIPANRQRELFKPFVRLHDGDHDGLSNGLGLSLAKQIIVSSGGQLWYEQRKHGGSRFIIELPEAASDATVGAAETPEPTRILRLVAGLRGAVTRLPGRAGGATGFDAAGVAFDRLTVLALNLLAVSGIPEQSGAGHGSGHQHRMAAQQTTGDAHAAFQGTQLDPGLQPFAGVMPHRRHGVLEVVAHHAGQLQGALGQRSQSGHRVGSSLGTQVSVDSAVLSRCERLPARA